MPEFLDPLNTARADRPYSPLVKSGDLVFISGQIGIDLGTRRIVEGGITAQTRQVLANIRALLQSQGLDMQNIVKTTVFLTRMSDFAEMNAAYRAAFGDTVPARSTVEVRALPTREALIEIEVIASFV